MKEKLINHINYLIEQRNEAIKIIRRFEDKATTLQDLIDELKELIELEKD